MLDNHDIRYAVIRDQWFQRTCDVKNNHEQEKDKGDEQTADTNTNVSVFSTKTSEWSGLQIKLYGSKQVTK